MILYAMLTSIMSGRLSRTKGHSFERQLAQDFREMGWDDCITTREAKGGNWSESDGGIDLRWTAPFLVQCKRRKDYVPVSTIEEVQYSVITAIDGIRCKPAEIPLVITKADRKPAMAILRWEDLQLLIKDSFP